MRRIEHIFVRHSKKKEDEIAISVTVSEQPEITSVNSFRNGSRPHRGREYRVTDAHSYDQRDGSDWEVLFRDRYDSFREELRADFYPDVTETFDNLWDFYKRIGYDYKKKRFSDEVQKEHFAQLPSIHKKPYHCLLLGDAGPLGMFSVSLPTVGDGWQMRKFNRTQGLFPRGREDEWLGGLWICGFSEDIVSLLNEKGWPRITANREFKSPDEFFLEVGYDKRAASFLQDREHISLDDLKSKRGVQDINHDLKFSG